MVRAMLRTFRDVRVGQVDLELAPAGMLLVIACGDPYGVSIGDQSASRLRGRRLRRRLPVPARTVGPGRHGQGVQVDLPWSTAAAVFGPETADLADRAVGLPDVSGGAELVDRLPEAAEPDRVRLVARWLRALLGQDIDAPDAGRMT